MSKRMPWILLLGLVAGAFFLARNNGIDSFDKLSALLKGAPASDGDGQDAPAVAERDSHFIRVATLNLDGLDDSRISEDETANLLANVVRRFDAIALQNIRARGPHLLTRLLEQVNADGAHYSHVLGPKLGPEGAEEQYAFVFDEASLEIDAETSYTVDDPDDLFAHEPLTAGFRVRGPEEQAAFTFTLVNVRLDEGRVEEEYALLADLFRAVRNDGRGEDDVIVLGDFGLDTRATEHPLDSPRFDWALVDSADAAATELDANLFFDSRATSEFSGAAGVLDVLREFNLTQQQVDRLSRRLPVWAEFALTEGGEEK